MANESLKVIITAENKSALDALKQVDAQAKSLGTTFVSTAGKMGDITKSSNTAAFALTNLGRVAQDAPFGFMGIQNNLNPLLESFQRLKTESGSSMGALKALGGSLMGAGGLGLALSVASSAFLLFGDKLFDTSKKADAAKKSIDDATQSIAKDASQVAVLTEQYKNSNLSLDQRASILKQLNQIAPEYFQGLKAEGTTYADLKVALDAYTASLANQIKAKVRGIELEKVIGDQLKKQDEQNKVIALQEDFAMKNKTGRAAAGSAILAKELLQLDKKAKLLEYEIAGLTKVKALEGKGGGGTDTTTEPKQIFDSFNGKSKFAEAEPVLQRILDIYKGISAESQKQYDLEIKKEIQIRTGSLFNSKFAGVANTAISGELSERDKIKQHRADVDESNDALQSWKDRNAEIQKFNTQMGISESLANAFGRAFEAIAIAEDPFVAFKDSLKQLIVDLAIAVAKMLIIEAIMAAIDPAGYAARKATGGITGAVGAHARGGVTTGPSMGLIGEAGPEAIMPLNNLKGFVDQAARIGAMNMAGGQSQSMTDRGGEFTLRGNDLVLAVQRAGYSLNLRR